MPNRLAHPERALAFGRPSSDTSGMVDTGPARHKLCILLLATTILLAGCPLVSDYPLSDPKASGVDQALVGEWKARVDEAEGWKIFTFLAFDEHELVGFAEGDEAGTIDSFRAFTTEIEGERFLNVRELGKSPSGWYFLRYEVDGPRLAMAIVDDELFKDRTFAGSAELREHLRRNVSDPRLFSPRSGEPTREMLWERVSKASD
jgi:hypothetical protein